MSASSWLLTDNDWRNTVSIAIERLDVAAGKMGVGLFPSHDPENVALDVAPVNPRYLSPHLSDRNFVEVTGLAKLAPDLVPRVATRSASRLYNWYGGATLATESRAMRIYYDRDDEPGHREHARIDCPIADRIHGRVAFNGALWVREDLRRERPELGGARLMQVVSAMGRMLALYLWDPDWIIATTPEKHRIDGISANYGWAGVEAASYTERLATGSTEACLMWSRREDIIQEAEHIAQHGIAHDEAVADAGRVLSEKATSLQTT